MKRKIRSFSLLELIVVMLITSVVVAVAYQGYSLFYKQFLSFRKNVELNSRVYLFDSRIFNDCAECREIRKNGDGLIFRFKNRNIMYEFLNDHIIRHQEAVTDTFYFDSPVVSFNYSGNKAEDQELVDEIKIETRAGEEARIFRYVKQYGPDMIINNSKNE